MFNNNKKAKIQEQAQRIAELEQQLLEKKEKDKPQKEEVTYAFSIGDKNFYNHYRIDGLNIVRFEQYQRCLKELESGIGTEHWKSLIQMLLKACNPDEKNRVDLATISYVAKEMEWISDRILAPNVLQEIFCLYMIEENEDPMVFDVVKHEEKIELFKKHGYLNISNDFFLEFLNNLANWGNMSESELKLSIQKQYMEEMYRDLKIERVAKSYLKDKK